MRLLLDTHAFIWWVEGNPRLPPSLVERIEQNVQTTRVSAASVWEVATLIRLNKLPQWPVVAEDELQGMLSRTGFGELSVTARHGELAGSMPGRHRDPFDRMLAAQALIEGLTLISRDGALDEFGVRRIWQDS
ncbi:MAG: type II toxin-antitoxin system VapC family toxin [Caenispirillum bisanense]|nr:type II toxin-antitoxin system VapC family toxin [Caenispirillum bisanense]MCA1973186.1 type II toxin-antitoxin system VapC family toxin [Caenispirillum sp.]